MVRLGSYPTIEISHRPLPCVRVHSAAVASSSRGLLVAPVVSHPGRVAPRRVQCAVRSKPSPPGDMRPPRGLADTPHSRKARAADNLRPHDHTLTMI